MKVFQSLIIAAVVAMPALSFAQSSTPDTAAQSQSALMQSEHGGVAQDSASAGVPRRAHRGGNRNDTVDERCTGPASYCNIFFGS